MSENTSSDDEEPETWTDESRQRVDIGGKRDQLAEQTLKEIERRRDSEVPAAHADEDDGAAADLASVDRKHGGDL